VDEEPNFEGEPASYGAALDDLTYVFVTGHDYYVETLYRNAFGVRVSPRERKRFRVDEGLVTDNPPSGPTEWAVMASRSGKVLVSAIYNRAAEPAALRANQWLIYLRADGTDPDPGPGMDTATVVEMTGPALTWQSEAYLDETPIRVLVRTRRRVVTYTEDEPPEEIITNYDSENVEVKGTTTDYTWQTIRRPVIALSRAYGQYAACETPGTVWIDQAKNIRWEVDGDTVRLMAGDVVIWTAGPEGIDTTFGVFTEAVEDAGGTGTVEVGTWTEESKILWVNVNGWHRMKIDVIGETIQVAGLEAGGGIHERPAHVPIWGTYTHTCFQGYNGETGGWETVMSLDGAGALAAKGWRTV
jgi:hypothetical protein